MHKRPAVSPALNKENRKLMRRDSLLSSLSSETDMEVPICSTSLKGNNLEIISSKKLSYRQKTKEQKLLPNEPKEIPTNLELSHTPSVTTKQKVIKQNKSNKLENNIDINPTNLSKHSPDQNKGYLDFPLLQQPYLEIDF